MMIEMCARTLLKQLAFMSFMVWMTAPVHSGSLEPPASAFDGSGNPAPTGARFPSWDLKLDSTNGDTTAGREGCDSDRFTCIWGDLAVRDNETGAVWQRTPAGEPLQQTHRSVYKRCPDLDLAGRKGWSLPTREELSSLMDPSNISPALPTGHPFLNVENRLTYTKTPDAASENTSGTIFPWTVRVRDAQMFDALDLNDQPLVWCVRSGRHGRF